jgi:hypothetical protein
VAEGKGKAGQRLHGDPAARVVVAGASGFAGAGGPPRAARLSGRSAGAGPPHGGFLIADGGSNNRIRRVDAAGMITTVAGSGELGAGAEAIAAVASPLNDVRGVAPTPDGGFLLTDFGNNRVRKVDAGGTIRTVAGTGAPSFGGDGGPATAATMRQPWDLEVAPDGSFLVTDLGNARVRRVDSAGTITTVAGTGSIGSSGDGGPATAAKFFSPTGLAPMPGGGFLVTDVSDFRVRWVEGAAPVVEPPDTDAPDTTIDGPPEGSATRVASAAFTYGATPATDLDHFECRLDSAAFATCPSSGMVFSGLADGTHVVAVRAVDAAGNADLTPATRSWTVDTVAPVITLATPTAGAAYRLTLPGILAGLVPATIASYSCSDGAGTGVGSCVGSVPNHTPIATGSLGSKTFTVTAEDALGNRATRTITYRVVLLGCLTPTLCI